MDNRGYGDRQSQYQDRRRDYGSGPSNYGSGPNNYRLGTATTAQDPASLEAIVNRKVLAPDLTRARAATKV